ncbi:DUF7674 family protein [Actinoplanes couchii]|nr:hypothetical protein [Actinoplanes couchii]MDR6322033.1 hypothetical protein [Actinoplanes couchii]
MSKRSPTYAGFRDYLWDLLPEAREQILFEELGEVGCHGDTDDLTAYRFMSMAFLDALAEAVERGDTALVCRGVAMVEEMLAAGDRDLDDVVQIRVLEKTGHTPGLTELFREYAGPITWRRMVYTEGLPPPERPATFGEPVPDGRPGPEASAVRDWLWKHVPLSRYPLLVVELDEVRRTMSLAAMTPERYIAEAVVSGMLRDNLNEFVPGHPDPELTEAAAAELELMVADPGMAALLRPHTATLTAEADRNPLLHSYAGPLLRAFLQG